MTTRDVGQRVRHAAAWVTPAQVAELLAIKLGSYHGGTAILAHHMVDDVMRPLVRARLLRSLPALSSIYGRSFRKPSITEYGERVLLHVAKQAMVKTGACASLDGLEENT